jgi:hypothetical protein
VKLNKYSNPLIELKFKESTISWPPLLPFDTETVTMVECEYKKLKGKIQNNIGP